MTVDTICVPINDNMKKISLSSYLSSSGGTDFIYILHGGKNIRVRVDQLWFWTDEWQAGEQEVDDYIRAGEYEEFDSLDAMFQALHER